jgi:hypothetical protein
MEGQTENFTPGGQLRPWGSKFYPGVKLRMGLRLAEFQHHSAIVFFLVSDPLCLSSSSALHFSDYSFWVHHPVNQDDRQLLANAMASDFSVAWQCLSKRTIGSTLLLFIFKYFFKKYS